MVELLVVLAVSAILMSLMYQVYRFQLKSHTTQAELVEMQQNMRAALYLMERDIRMAGFAPRGGLSTTPISSAQVRAIAFDMDLTTYGTFDATPSGTGDPGESLAYFIDPGTGHLMRWASGGAGNQVLLRDRDIDDINFVYKDADGVTLDDDGAGNLTTTASLEAIRSVVITLNSSIGTTAMVAPHQMQLRSEVKVRNLGLVP